MNARAALLVGMCGMPMLSFMATPTLAADQTVPSDTDSLDEVVVTGSRLITNGFDAPTPVTVLTADVLAEKAPTSVSDALLQLPQFMGSTSIASARTATTTVGSAGTSQSTYLDLYSLGSNRMLILQDGKRVPPNTVNGSTDAGMFPEMLLQRVDIVTGGASAAYGSDAISGVVNFITDKKFEGLKALVQGGQSSHGDMQSYRYGLAGGVGLLNDRLHLIGSAEQYRNDGIPRNSDRPWGDSWGSGGKFGAFSPSGAIAGTAGNPYIGYQDEHYAIGTSLGGQFNTGALAGRTLVDGVPVLVSNGTRVHPIGCTNCPDNYFSAVPDQTLVPSINNVQAFGRAQYEVNSSLNVWAQTSYANSRTVSRGAPGAIFLGSITVFPDNAYLSPAARAALAGAPAIFSTFYNNEDFPQSTADNENKSLNLSAGLEGEFGDTWKWDFTFGHGTAKSNFSSDNQVYLPKAYAAFDAVVNPANGQIVCSVTMTNPGLFPGCEPFNLFGPNAYSPAAAAYIQDTSWVNQTLKQDAYQVNLRGAPFSLWAGPLSVAVGVEFRDESYTLTSNSPAAPRASGLRGVLNTSAFSIQNTQPSTGSRDVKEAYVEVLLPLAQNLPLVESLDLAGAVRRTDYSTSGLVTTWKVGLNWAPINDVRVRATLSQDIRAPSLGELFQGRSQTITVPLLDPHTGVLTSYAAVSGGNPDLDAEESRTFTGGVIYSPSWLQGTRVSLDYFRFELSEAIARPYSAMDIVRQCEESDGTSTLCDLVIRPLPFSDRSPANAFTAINIFQVNVAEQNVSGLNLELDYRNNIGPGNLNARLLVTNLIENELSPSPGSPITYLAGYTSYGAGGGLNGLPKFRANAQVGYRVGPWGVTIQERFIGPVKLSYLPNEVYEHNRYSAAFYTDLNFSYDFQPVGDAGLNVQAFFHASNLFDKQAPLVPYTNGPGNAYSSDTRLYDVVGLNFTAGARLRF